MHSTINITGSKQVINNYYIKKILPILLSCKKTSLYSMQNIIIMQSNPLIILSNQHRDIYCHSGYTVRCYVDGSTRGHHY